MTPSKADQKIITLEEFGQDVMRRRAALGGDIDMPRNSGERRTASKREIDIPRNSGKRRTESKRALLEAFAAAGKIW